MGIITDLGDQWTRNVLDEIETKCENVANVLILEKYHLVMKTFFFFFYSF